MATRIAARGNSLQHSPAENNKGDFQFGLSRYIKLPSLMPSTTTLDSPREVTDHHRDTGCGASAGRLYTRNSLRFPSTCSLVAISASLDDGYS